jgi:hypothetical protein
MPRASNLPLERRKAEVAGRVMLQVLRALPESATAELLRDLIDITVVKPEDRALFDFLGGGRAKPDEEAAPVTGPRSPVLSGGAAAVWGVCLTERPTKLCGNSN